MSDIQRGGTAGCHLNDETDPNDSKDRRSKIGRLLLEAMTYTYVYPRSWASRARCVTIAPYRPLPLHCGRVLPPQKPAKSESGKNCTRDEDTGAPFAMATTSSLRECEMECCARSVRSNCV